MKKWKIAQEFNSENTLRTTKDIVEVLLKNRGLTTKKQQELFLNPPDPHTLTAKDVGINETSLKKALKRVQEAIANKESIVVYSDYDADGITGSAVLWETLHYLGANVMPHVPHRVEEGYGFSKVGIDMVKKKYSPTLIISVDHGISARDKIKYARRLGIEVIVTDHHVIAENPPDNAYAVIHTTQLSGSGVAWFFSKEISKKQKALNSSPGFTLSISEGLERGEFLALVTIGTIADLVPLVGPNRAIATYGLEFLNKTQRLGLMALIEEAGLEKGTIDAYHVSHILAPRINAVGRLTHALDALRLLCTKSHIRAQELAQLLGSVNRERQHILDAMILHAKTKVKKNVALLFVADESYNQGVIGLVAGKLVEEFYRPSIVLSKGEKFSKASARSIAGFNIVETLRQVQDLLVDVGGHPMAAGFTVENEKLVALEKKLIASAQKHLTQELLTPSISVDCELFFSAITHELYKAIQQFAPFGIGNPTPVFVARNLKVLNTRLIGRDNTHLKLKISPYEIPNTKYEIQCEAIGFRMGNLYSQLSKNRPIDICFTIDENHWNGNTSLQLKLKDIHFN